MLSRLVMTVTHLHTKLAAIRFFCTDTHRDRLQTISALFGTAGMQIITTTMTMTTTVIIRVFLSCHELTTTNISHRHTHGLSRRYDGSHHHEWDLLWARSPIRERHIRWQIWHLKLLGMLVDGGPDLGRSRLASNS